MIVSHFENYEPELVRAHCCPEALHAFLKAYAMAADGAVSVGSGVSRRSGDRVLLLRIDDVAAALPMGNAAIFAGLLDRLAEQPDADEEAWRDLAGLVRRVIESDKQMRRPN